MYIGDIFIDEITVLGYSTMLNKTPVYGYASRYFDTTMQGQELVQGEFMINFKEAGYLWVVLRRWFNMGPGAAVYSGSRAVKEILTKSQARSITKGRKGVSDPDAYGGTPIVGSNGTLVSRASVQRLINGEVSDEERNDFYHDLTGYATAKVGSPKDKVFEDIVEVYEDQIWGSTTENLISQARSPLDPIFDGFDIYVVFGNYSNPAANHTANKIVGVRLVGQSKQVQIDGAPIQESYSFIARTIL